MMKADELALFIAGCLKNNNLTTSEKAAVVRVIEAAAELVESTEPMIDLSDYPPFVKLETEVKRLKRTVD